MSDEKRMAGDYEIIQSVHIGDREIIIGKIRRPQMGCLIGWPSMKATPS